MGEWSAWYSGDPDRIIDAYSGASPTSGGQIPWWRFWSRARAGTEGDQRAQLHVPIASDLAATSGALLFGERPLIRVKSAHEDKKPSDDAEEPIDTEQTPAQKTEKRLLEMIQEGDVYSRLLEAAESAAAIGGVYIYPVWDKDFRSFPLLAIAQSDMAVPEFKWGYLSAVTFHRVVEVDGSRVLRHVERHEVEGTGEKRKCVVLHGLYDGSASFLGDQKALTAHQETARLQPKVTMPFPELDVQYIPNIRPNRLWRASGFGVADIQGSESLLDALDEVYASWMRDIRLAKARIIVPRDYLRTDEDGEAGFDVDQEVYVAMEMEPSLNADARTMLAHQFAIRYMEHRATARDLVERIVSNAGYVASTLGQSSDSGTARTGTALRISEHKTLLTLRRKGQWWKTALEMVFYHMLQIDKAVFEGTVEPMRPTVDISDSVIDQPLELAQTALAMKSAEAASVETRVRTLHPDWSDAEVIAESRRIQDEAKAMIELETPDTFGDPMADPASSGNVPMKDQSRKQPGTPPPSPTPFAKKV